MTPIRMDTVVGPGGKVEGTVPLPAGTSVEVIVRGAEVDDCRDLVEAAQSSTGFWDNPLDDEDWNDAPAR